MGLESAGGRGVLVVLVLVTMELVAAVALAVIGAAGSREGGGLAAHHQTLADQLWLTDLALWSGVSYCRHPSQADLFAPHAAHPSALEYLPAGSIVPPRPLGPVAGGAEGVVRFGEP